MAHMPLRVRRRRLAPRLVSLASALALVTAVTVVRPPDQAAAAHPETAGQEQYLGRWNYDLPDRESLRNVIVIDLPGSPLQVPQVGDIVFSKGADGTVIGRTDQGCTQGSVVLA